MLIAQNLTKRYGKVLANDHISFEIPDGSVTVMLGPNGAGKSTAIKSVLGLIRHEGRVTIDGIETHKTEAKRLLGYIPEIPYLYKNLTVDEHLEFVARAYKLSDYRTFADELLDRMELTEHKKKFGDELSKGMQQKLSICCGLLPRPALSLFDEPMIGLDPHAIKELKQLFTEMRDRGQSMLISTHMIDSVDMLWDRTLIMKKGRVLANVERAVLEEDGKTLEELFFELTEEEPVRSAEAKESDS